MKPSGIEIKIRLVYLQQWVIGPTKVPTNDAFYEASVPHDFTVAEHLAGLVAEDTLW